MASWLHGCGQRPVVLGWGPSEIGVVEALAARGIAIHASDWAVNLPSYASFHAPVLQQRRPPPAANAAVSPQGKHTVTFLLSDGDNLQARASQLIHVCDRSRFFPLQWLVGGNFASPLNDWWGSSSRGSVAIGWTMSPAMAEVAPSILQRFYAEATASDNFIAGPSGVAYTFPDAMLNETSFAVWSLQYMQRSGLAIVNVIASSDCDVECASPYVEAGADAVFLYTYG